jgi:hypothetical protein
MARHQYRAVPAIVRHGQIKQTHLLARIGNLTAGGQLALCGLAHAIFHQN